MSSSDDYKAKLRDIIESECDGSRMNNTKWLEMLDALQGLALNTRRSYAVERELHLKQRQICSENEFNCVSPNTDKNPAKPQDHGLGRCEYYESYSCKCLD